MLRRTFLQAAVAAILPFAVKLNADEFPWKLKLPTKPLPEPDGPIHFIGQRYAIRFNPRPQTTQEYQLAANLEAETLLPLPWSKRLDRLNWLRSTDPLLRDMSIKAMVDFDLVSKVFLT